MSATDEGQRVTVGTAIRLATTLAPVGILTDDAALELRVRKPDGTEDVFTGLGLSHDGTGAYHKEYVPSLLGVYEWRWNAPTVEEATEGQFEVISEYLPTVTDPNDVRVMVPRVRRSVEGVIRAKWLLTDDEVKDLVADAIADVILYTGQIAGAAGTIFGVTLEVKRTDQNGSPIEYATSKPLKLDVQSVIAAQAALNYFFYRFSGQKVSETISDEASSWSYDLSPQLLTTQLKLLAEQRDKAIEALVVADGVLDSYLSFVAARDQIVSRQVESWVWGHPEGQGVGAGGLEGDFRFDSITSGGGDYPLP